MLMRLNLAACGRSVVSIEVKAIQAMAVLMHMNRQDACSIESRAGSTKIRYLQSVGAMED
jgi:hypothetical protein